jgi:hypothetical protein
VAEITGDIKTGDGTNVLDVNKTLTISKKAFFRCPMSVGTVLTVNGKSGFEKQISPLDNQMQLKDNAFFNSPYPSSWNSSVNMNNHDVKYKSVPDTKFINKGPGSASSSTIDIAAELGMAPGNEHSDTVVMPSMDASIIQTSSSDISASSVETLWTHQKTAGKLYNNKWLILKLGNTVGVSGTGTFTKRVVIIAGDFAINANGGFYDCADTSNTLIYLNGSGYFNGMGVPDNKRFRGYIYVNSSYASNISYQFGKKTKFYGAICHSKGKFDLNGGGPLNLFYDAGSLGESAIKELIADGFIVTAGTSPSPYSPGLNLVDYKIRPTLLGMQL